MHRPWKNGVELLQDALHNKRVLPTGCTGIDSLLGGGLREGQLIELVGPSASGKTQVCLQSASNIALHHKGIVMYFDTSNSFSTKRILDMVRQGSNFAGIEESVLSRILCHSVFDIFTLLDVLRRLECSLDNQVINTYEDKIHLLVVDSLSSLITPILGGRNSNGRSLMIIVGFLLKKLAYEHNISVLVTNHMVGGEGGIQKPALGESWKYIPHIRLMLSCSLSRDMHCASILKHPSIACGQAESFSMQA